MVCVPEFTVTLNDYPKTHFQATVEEVHTFLTIYVEENAISLPGRIPGFKSDDIKVLSSSKSKIGIWRVYEAACLASDVRAVSYRKFLQFWDQFYPNVVFQNQQPISVLPVSKIQTNSKGLQTFPTQKSRNV